MEQPGLAMGGNASFENSNERMATNIEGHFVGHYGDHVSTVCLLILHELEEGHYSSRLLQVDQRLDWDYK